MLIKHNNLKVSAKKRNSEGADERISLYLCNTLTYCDRVSKKNANGGARVSPHEWQQGDHVYKHNALHATENKPNFCFYRLGH